MYRWKGKFVSKKVYEAMLQRRLNGLDRWKNDTVSDQSIPVNGNRIINLQQMTEEMICSVCKEPLLLQDIKS